MVIYDVVERVMLRRFAITNNKSLDGVLDQLNSKWVVRPWLRWLYMVIYGNKHLVLTPATRNQQQWNPTGFGALRLACHTATTRPSLLPVSQPLQAHDGCRASGAHRQRGGCG